MITCDCCLQELVKQFLLLSGREVKKDDVKDVVEAITKLKTGDKVLLLVAFKQHHNRDIKEELNILMQKGFSRIYVDKRNFKNRRYYRKAKDFKSYFQHHTCVCSY
ncbi:MAG: hypothetical protein WKF59_25065 [Chitinophagaceae bacterium]